MKIIMIIIILAICFFITVYKTDNIKKHTIAIRQCVMMIDNIEIMLNYNNTTIEKMMDCLLNSDNYYLLSFIPKIHTLLINNIFSGEVIPYDKSKLFDKEDVTFINGFFSNLGKSDVQGQLSNCKLYKEFLKNKLSKLEQSEKTNCKSISVVIMGIGFVISVLLV